MIASLHRVAFRLKKKNETKQNCQRSFVKKYTRQKTDDSITLRFYIFIYFMSPGERNGRIKVSFIFC